MNFKEKSGNFLYDLVHTTPKNKIIVIIREVILAILLLLSFIYSFVIKARLFLYSIGFFRSTKVACFVISLGNITLGGTGKTPLAQKLALDLKDRGHNVTILNRGYKANFKGEIGLVSDGQAIYMEPSECGDEAYLLAKTLNGVSVVIGRDRGRTGWYAKNKLNTNVIIVDDGYQHLKIKRDLNVVLIDTLNPFGNKFVLPRGTLREPLGCLNRANLFVLTKSNQTNEKRQNEISDELKKYNNRAKILESFHASANISNIKNWLEGLNEDDDKINVQDQEILAFSAIGNPESFKNTLQEKGFKILGYIPFPDHHFYTSDELEKLGAKACFIKAKALMTTEKDAVKIPVEFIEKCEIPIYVLSIKITFKDQNKYYDLLDYIEDGINKYK